jgi:peroxiredoxin
VNGKVIRLSDYKGTCQIEIPWFIDFQRKYKDQGFVVIGVSLDDDGWKAVTPFAQKMRINYPIVMGNDPTADLYGAAEALPTTVLVDRNGNVASIHVGLAGKQEFQDAIEKLLEAPAETHAALRNPGDRTN